MSKKCTTPILKARRSSDHGKVPTGSQERVGYELKLGCRSCGNEWLVLPGPDGEFFPGFWRCPRGCDS